MLYEIMRHIRNFFVYKSYKDKFTIKDGVLDLDEIKDGMYFLIEGSLLNDGVYQAPVTLQDEEFNGLVAILNPPHKFIELSTEISTYVENHKANPYSSESFGGYSYTRATNKSGNLVGWQDVFRNRLNTWRKL